MEKEEIFEKIRKMISDRIEIDSKRIKLNSNFANDLGVDSLDIYELVYAAEEEFRISIPDQDIKFKTVREFYNYVLKEISKPH